jgi:hypothetical protein
MPDPKIQILIEAVNKTQAELGKVKADLDGLKGKAAEVASATKDSFAKVNTEATTLKEAITKLKGSMDPLKDTLQGVATGTTSAGQGLSSIGNILGGLAGKLGLVAGAVVGIAAIKNHMDEAASATQQWGSEVGKLSRMTGMGAQSSSEFLGVAKMMGITFDQLAPTITQLAKRMGGVKDAEMSMVDETGATVDVFDKLGIKIKDDVTGNLVGFSGIWNQLRETVSKEDNPFQRLIKLGMVFKGTLAAEVMPLVTMTKERLAELVQKTHEYGLALTSDNVVAIRQMTLAERELETAQLGKKVVLGQTIIPLYTQWTKLLIDVIGLVNKLSKSIKEMWQGSSDPKEIQAGIDHWEKMEKWALERGDQGLAEKYNALADAQRARMGGIAKAAKEEEAAMGQALPTKPKKVKETGPTLESIAMKYYQTDLGLADRYARDDYTIIESAKNKELELLKNSHEKGLIDQETYEEQIVEIMKGASTDEDAVLNDRIGRIKAAFAKLSESGLLDSDKLAAEKTKVQSQLDEINTTLEKNANQREIIDIQEDTRRVQSARKIKEVNDQEIAAYETMSNRIAKSIDEIKVKNNEMLPGQALLAEHEREIDTLAAQIERALERVKSAGAMGSPAMTKAVMDYKLLKEKMVELDVKSPEIKKESARLDAERTAANNRALNEQHLNYAFLIGDMTLYNDLQMKMSIEELKTRQIRAEGQPELIAGLQKQIDYMQGVLDKYEEFGPAYTGFIEGLKDIERESKDTFNKAKGYTKEFVEAFSSVPTKMFEDWLKFDGNFLKDLDSLKNYWKDFWGSMVKIFSEIFMDEMKILISGFLKGLTGGKGGGLGGALGSSFFNWLTGSSEDTGTGFNFSGFGGSSDDGSETDWDPNNYWGNQSESFGKSSGDSSSGGLGGIAGTALGLLGLYGKIKSIISLPEKLASLPDKVQNLYTKAIEAYDKAFGVGAETLPTQGSEIALTGSEDLAGYAGYEGAGTNAAITTTAAAGSEAGSGLTGLSAGGYAMVAAPLVMAYMKYQAGSGRNEPREQRMETDKYTSMLADLIKSGDSNINLGDRANQEKYNLPWMYMPQEFYESAGAGPDKNFIWDKIAGYGLNGKGEYLQGEAGLQQIMDNLTKMGITEEQVTQLWGVDKLADIYPKVMKDRTTQSIEDTIEQWKNFTDSGNGVGGDRNEMGANLKAQIEGLDEAQLKSLATNEKYRDTLAALGIDLSKYANKENNLINIIDSGTENLITEADAVSMLGDSWGAVSAASDVAMVAFNQLTQAKQLLADGLQGDEPAQYADLLEQLRKSIEENGDAFLGQIPNIGSFIEILRSLGITISELPDQKDISITTTYNQNGEPPSYDDPNNRFHSGGFVGRYHKGGFLKYHPWGGGIGGDEVPIIAQKGEYVLSRKDVEFIDKVKGIGHVQVNNIPALLPMVNVVVNNQSGTQVQSAGAVRIDDGKYIIDVLLKDLHSNGRLRRALSFG